MTPPVKFDRSRLYQQYVVDGLGTRAIAAERGCSMYGVISALRRFGIEVRKTGGQPTHGATIGAKPTTEYRIWKGMMRRCFNVDAREYPRYGGRGIRVCSQWCGEQGFETFLADMGARPNMTLTLDRIDGDGNYEPSNCRWATKIEQARQNRKLTDAEVRSICADPRPCSEITRSYRISRARVLQMKRGETPGGIITPRVPSFNPAIKLNIDIAREIRRRYATGTIYQRTLALEYGVNQVLISQIVTHKIWRDDKRGRMTTREEMNA